MEKIRKKMEIKKMKTEKKEKKVEKKLKTNGKNSKIEIWKRNKFEHKCKKFKN